MKLEDDLLKKLLEIYEEAYKQAIKELDSFYLKYADENGDISYVEAMQYLEIVDLAENAKQIQYLNNIYKQTGDEQVLRKIEQLSAQGQVTRLQALINAIDVAYTEAAAKAGVESKNSLGEIYKRSYKEASKKDTLTKVPTHAIEAALATNWIAGGNYSSRIWANKDKVIQYLRSSFLEQFTRGVDVRKVARDGALKSLLKDTNKNVRYNTERLVRTEAMAMYNMGALDRYKDMNVKYLRIMATIDGRTCPDCKDWDGDVVAIENAIVGDTIPPLHPLCRCTVTPEYGLVE